MEIYIKKYEDNLLGKLNKKGISRKKIIRSDSQTKKSIVAFSKRICEKKQKKKH